MARYNAATSAEEISRLAGVLESLQNDSGILLPEGVALEFLEARRTGASGTYRELADWCNDELSKIVLGQTLTSGEGRRSGSLALGEVHDRVRAEYMAADARALGEALSGQLVRWLVDFNFGTDMPAPRLVFDCSDPDSFRQELEIDQQLVRMGVALPAEYFYERYRRPAPEAGERALRYDDANLYQYHLQFGVLTINEVRATLGLPPVAWGNVPPSDAGPMAAVRAREADAQALDNVDEARKDARKK